MSVAAIWCFSSDGPSASSEAAGRFSFLFQYAACLKRKDSRNVDEGIDGKFSMGVLNEGNIRFRKT